MLALSLADASEYEVDARLDAIVTALRFQTPGERDVEGRGDVEIGRTAVKIICLDINPLEAGTTSLHLP